MYRIAREIGAWRHAILSLAAQRAQHCQESLLSILEKSDTKKIKDKTVGELKDCLVRFLPFLAERSDVMS